MERSIAAIQVNTATRRRLCPEKVRELAGSIREVGLLNPITVTEGNALIAGLHRLEACRSLGWAAIPASVVPLSGLEAELAEIDENLVRNDLTAMEQGEQLVRREDVLRRMGLRAERGDNRFTHRGETVSPLPKTTAQVAAEVGLSERSAQQRKQAATKITEDVREAIRQTPVADQTTDLLALARMKEDEQRKVASVIAKGEAPNVKTAVRVVHQQQRAEERAEAEISGKSEARSRLTLHHCAVADLAERVPPGSVDTIVTDPPYPKDALPLYSDLAAFAAHALRPGGSLLVMCGHSYLPEIIRRLGEHLSYHWTLAYLTPGGQSAQVFPRKVNPFWKPIFWFVKGEYAGPWQGDLVSSDVNDNDKRFHKWGQSESGTARLVEGWTRPGELVCDPFLGGGTTAVVALRLGRRVIGADVDEEALRTTEARVAREDD